MDYSPQKSIWKWVILAFAIVILLLILFTLYLDYKEGLLLENQPQINNSKTAGWKTYANTKYGFELQHPATFSPIIIDYKDPESLAKNNIDATFDSGDLFLSIDEFIHDSNNLVCAQYNVTVQKISNKNVDEWVEYFKKTIETPSDYEGMQISGKVTSVEDSQVQGNKAKLITIQGGFPFFSEQFVVMDNGKFYSINYLDMSLESDRKCANDQKYYKGIFDKMILTFTFTN